jgi:predicted DNA-binding transcriptional regulator AlpA
MPTENTPNKFPAFMRLSQILKEIPVSGSTWWIGCKDGRYPKPVKIGHRVTAWRGSDIAELVEKLSSANND